jgi:hypothetical protein
LFLLAYHPSDLHTLYTYVLVFVFCLFVLNKPFSDSLFCRADNKGTYMIVNYCPINKIECPANVKSGTIIEIFWFLPVLFHFSFVSTWKRSHFSLWFQSSGSPELYVVVHITRKCWSPKFCGSYAPLNLKFPEIYFWSSCQHNSETTEQNFMKLGR